MFKLDDRIEGLYSKLRLGTDTGVGFVYADPVRYDGRTVSLGNKEVLHFANCCYLGLETDPRVKQAAMDSIERYGMLMSNSRAFLSSPLYAELEELLDEMMPGHTVVFPTTTLGHCSNLPVLIGREDLIVCDVFAHNSVQMAAKLCVANGTEFVRLPHNDMRALEEIVCRPEHRGRRIWFLGDGIYSMQGELLDLENLVQVLNRCPDLYAYLDDAHGFSWRGKNGAGYVLGGGRCHPQIITAVSMCKSFGSFGGIAVFPDEALADRLRHIGQTQIFSAPLPTAALAASVASAKIHLSDELPTYQAEVEERIHLFKSESHQFGLPVNTKAFTPMQFIEIGTTAEVASAVKDLLARNYFCAGAVYPSVARGHGGLRVSITRHLQPADISALIRDLAELLAVRGSRDVS